jgi:tungstate transport system permease protein
VIREGFQEALQLLLRLDASVLDAATRSLWVAIVAVTAASVCGITIGLLLARKQFSGRTLLVVLFRVGMSVPTVLIGLLCYGLLSRRGVLGDLELLYTTWAIVIGEFFLALPIVATLTHGAITRLDPRVAETAQTLGAGTIQRAMTYLCEARLAIVLAVLTAFSRCFTELGIAMMVGGNIPDRTRTLTTATALETARGEFASGVAMSLILLAIAMLVTLAIATLSREPVEATL